MNRPNRIHDPRANEGAAYNSGATSCFGHFDCDIEGQRKGCDVSHKSADDARLVFHTRARLHQHQHDHDCS